jgi:hypothetical protein
MTHRGKPLFSLFFFLLAVASPGEEKQLRSRLIEASRPSKAERLPAEMRDRVGTTLVAGKYHLTDKPNLVEGAEAMLGFGTRLGKFWFDPSRAASDYPFNSAWPRMRTLAELGAAPHWREVFDMPFRNIILIAESPVERGWKEAKGDEFYAAISKEFEEVTRSLYERYGTRELTVILQNWEGDWQLRGTGETWNPPPPDWKILCERFAKRLHARQQGVARARADFPEAKLQVLHAAEVNRVRDQWAGIPTMTEHVLPHVDLDLVSYSCYDAMSDGETLFRAIETVRRFAKTNGPHGGGAVYLGEIGIPENVAKRRIEERWDELLGAALAADALYVAQWQLYCNELNPKFQPHPKAPIHEEWRLRGFWLLKPDGSLSPSGKYFKGFWAKAGN